MEYLMTLINSSFEEWRFENPNEDINSFEFSLDNMSKSGALFDIVKLNDVSKECLARMSEKSIARELKSWANEYGIKRQGAKKAVIDAIIHEDEGRLAKMLSVGRNGNNPRKDLAYCEQIAEFIIHPPLCQTPFSKKKVENEELFIESEEGISPGNMNIRDTE